MNSLYIKIEPTEFQNLDLSSDLSREKEEIERKFGSVMIRNGGKAILNLDNSNDILHAKNQFCKFYEDNIGQVRHSDIYINSKSPQSDYKQLKDTLDLNLSKKGTDTGIISVNVKG